MESGYLAVLSSKGQLTVPKPLRKRFHLVDGQRLALEGRSQGSLVKKATIQGVDEELEEAEWEALKRLASKKGKTYKTGKAFLKSLKSR